jgi:peptidoglycan/xylan/chitin deacetylase (PgdA/CDA1 family)
MKLRMPLLLFAFLPVAVWAQSVSIPQLTPWPQDRTAAISLTFDDGTPTHLSTVGPILKKHHLNGTFYVVTGGGTWSSRFEDWRRLAAEGNEIGSHSVHHPCLLPQFRPNSADYTPEMMRAEAGDSAREIAARLGIQRGLTFAYPCATMTFGPPAEQARNEVLYLGDAAEFYFAARGDNGGLPVTPMEMNPLSVHGLGRVVGLDYPHLLALMEPAMRNHEWGVYIFHGVGGDGLSTSVEAFENLAAHLEQHRDLWCATFGDVFRYIQERKGLEIRLKESDSRHVQFELNWPLDAKTFDLPLTLKWQAPDDWTAYQCETDGHPRVSTKSLDPKAVLVDIPPQTKVLRFEAK